MDTKEKEKLVESLLKRGHISETISDENIKDILSKKSLRIKWGTDPTSEKIHLGRSVPILLLRDLQLLGHQIIVIIGDFTAEVGDTSDKESERPVINPQIVQQNMKTYIEQIGMILDLKKTEFQFNSQWWKNIPFSQFVRLTDLFSLAEFSARSNIAKRLKSGNRVSVREMIYPIMQGYDSVAMNADIEVGGIDQRYNFLAGRKIQKILGKKPQSLIMTNLINGLDGRKMSSSWGNTINITDKPEDMYGKIMSLGDEMIITYFVHLTGVPIDHINKLKTDIEEHFVNPRDVKMKLARNIVSFIHGEDLSAKAEFEFRRVFQQKKNPLKITEYEVDNRIIVDVLVEIGFAKSKSDARRLIKQKSVAIDGKIVKTTDFTVPDQFILKKGKRNFANVIVLNR